MEKTVTFYINRTTPAKLEEELVICKPLKRLTIWVDVEKEEHTLMGYLVVRDEKNRIRIQKMLGYGERTIVIARHAKNTTIGGVPGPIGAGTWKIVIYLRSILNKHWKVYLCHSEFRSLTGKRRFRRQSASVSGWTDTTGSSSGLATITRVVFTAAGGDGTREIFTPIRICQMGRSRSAAL